MTVTSPLQHLRLSIMVLTAAATILCLSTGCSSILDLSFLSSDGDQQVSPEASWSPEVLAQRSTDELSAELQTAYNKLMELDADLKSQNEFKHKVLKEQVRKCLAYSEALVSRAELSPSTLTETWKLRLQTLYLGAKRGYAEYEANIEAAAEQIRSEYPGSEQDEFAQAMLLEYKYFHDADSLKKALGAVKKHAETFPEGETSVNLFRALVATMEKLGEPAAAIECCEVAADTFEDEHTKTAFHKLAKVVRKNADSLALSKDPAQKLIVSACSLIRPRLPMRIDPITTLTDIQPGRRSIIYTYEVSLSYRELMGKSQEIQQAVTARARKVRQTRCLLEADIRLIYRYYDSSKKAAFNFVVTKQ